MRPPTIAERAYESYLRFCERVQVTPQPQDQYDSAVRSLTEPGAGRVGFHLSESDLQGTKKMRKGA